MRIYPRKRFESGIVVIPRLYNSLVYYDVRYGSTLVKSCTNFTDAIIYATKLDTSYKGGEV